MVQGSDVWEHLWYNKTLLENFKKNMNLITQRVEWNIERILPSKISLTFDGQYTKDAHYVGLFVSFPADNLYEYRAVSLTISLLQNESREDADEHIAFIEFEISVYSDALKNVVALTAENCGTNQ